MSMPPLIVDAHEDLAYSILNFGRDYTRAAEETRRSESSRGSTAPALNGDTLLGWPDYQRGRVAVVFSTLFVTPIRRVLGEWDHQAYRDAGQAHSLYRAQLDLYRKLTDEAPGFFRLITTRDGLESVLKDWEDPAAESHPVGLVPLMEGAEGVRTPAELEDWWQWGLRIIGPAWAGTRFCGGSRDPGPLTEEGVQLLKGMAEIGFALDVSHMDEAAVRQALDLYPGTIIASHANAAALVPNYEGNRLLQDDVIRGLLKRDAIIGVVPFCKFLDYGWTAADGRQGITLETLAAHVDRICQMAGDALHVGLGTDFDGGFGLQAAPQGVDTIADMQKLGPVLAAKGYNDDQVAAVLGKNWLRCLQNLLP